MCVGSLRQHVFASKDVRPLQDVVNDFRGRGIQIALAMVGNRLDRSRPYQARLCGAQALGASKGVHGTCQKDFPEKWADQLSETPRMSSRFSAM